MNSTLMSNDEINIKLSLLPQFLQNKISSYANSEKKQQRIYDCLGLYALPVCAYFN